MSNVRPPSPRSDSGFTVLELLIVIVILGVIAGIAFLSVNPFRDAADMACWDAESNMNQVIYGAEGLGIDASVDRLDCADAELVAMSGTSSGCPGGALNCSETVLPTTPEQGHTLVLISAHRGSFVRDGYPTVVGDPSWNLRGVFNAGLCTTSARGIAVWTKIADTAEPTHISVDWGPGINSPNNGCNSSPGNYSRAIIVQEFNRTLTSFAISPGASTSGTSLAMGPASLTRGPALVVAGLATRGAHCSPPATCGVTWSGVDRIREAGQAQDSSVHTRAGWASVRSGEGPHEAHATWVNNVPAVGFTMVLRP